VSRAPVAVEGARVGVLGLAKSGSAVARLLARRGARVYASDVSAGGKAAKAAAELEQAGVEIELGRHDPARLAGCDWVVTSPGIPPDAPVLRDPAVAALPIYSEIEVASWFAEAPIAAVTGTNGKTTTTELLGRIARAGGIDASVAGNIGRAFSTAILEDADVDLAVEGAVWGAFGTTGQRCTASSRLLVHEDVVAEFTDKLVARATSLSVGNGLEPGVEVGPCISERQRETVARYVEIGKEEGAQLLCGGEKITEGSLSRGFFFAPTVFGEATPDMRISREEIFGPVTTVIPIASFEEGIRVANSVEYGLSGSVYTRDVDRAFRAMREFETGIFYVNSSTIGAEVHLPFGGVKNTGNGHREAGIAGIEVFTEWKSIYVDFSGRLQRAQIDTHESAD